VSALLVVQNQWHDPGKRSEYAARLGATLVKYGGRVLFAGEPALLEGRWVPPRLVLVEFPTLELLHEWYNSPEYAPLIRLRQAGAETNMVVAEESPA
jgi:uncharacterized protein (DUF1330 family)